MPLAVILFRERERTPLPGTRRALNTPQCRPPSAALAFVTPSSDAMCDIRLLLLLALCGASRAARQPWPPSKEAVANICRGPPFVQVRLLLDIEFVAEPQIANATAHAIANFLTAANGITPLSEGPLQLLIASGRNTWVLPFERAVSTINIVNFLRLWSRMLQLHSPWGSKSMDVALKFAAQWPSKGVPRVLIVFAAGKKSGTLWGKMHLVRDVVDRVVVLRASGDSRYIHIELGPTKHQSSTLADIYGNLARIICTLESCPAVPTTATPTFATKMTEITTLKPFTVTTNSGNPSTLQTTVSAKPTKPSKTVPPSTTTSPVKSTTPMKPTKPIKTVPPSTTMSSVKSTTQVNPTKPIKTIHPSTTMSPVKSTTPVNPTKPIKTVPPSTTMSPVKSTTPMKPTKPIKTVPPSTTMSPVKSTTQVTPTKPSKTVPPSTTMSPVKSTTPMRPTKPIKTVPPSTMSPGKSTTPMRPTKPIKTVPPSTTMSPVKSTTPMKPTKPIKTVPPSTTMSPTVGSTSATDHSLKTTLSTKPPASPKLTTNSPPGVCSLYKRLLLLLQKEIKKVWTDKTAAEVKNKQLAKELTTCSNIRTNLTQLIKVSSAEFVDRYAQLKNRTQKLQTDLAVCRSQAKMLAEQHKSTLARLQKVQAQLSEVESDLKSQQQAAVALRVALEKARAQAQVLTERLRAVDAKRQQVEAELALEKERAKTAQKQHEAALERMRKELLQLERERDKLLRALAEAKTQTEQIAAKASELLREMQARASILLFFMRSGTGLTFSDAFYSDDDYSTEDAMQNGRLYKSRKLQLWTIGRYRRISMILRKRGRPVVRLDFDGKRASRFNWFSRSNLLNSFPWPTDALTKLGTMMMGSAKTATHLAVMSRNATCLKPQGFIAILDSAVTCFWTWTPRLGRFPHFLYSFNPTGQVGLLSDARDRREADSLEIRVIPYVTFYKTSGMAGHFARWDFEHQYLVFSVTAGTSLDPAAMWQGQLISPPQFFTNLHLLNSDWFRSAALNTWPSARYRRAVLSLVDAVGDVTASFEFNLVGASRDNWFSLARLRSATPWSAREIRQSKPKNFRIGKSGDAFQFLIGGDKSGRVDCTSTGFLVVVTNTTGLPCVRGARPVLIGKQRTSSLQAPLLHAPKHEHQLRISMM